MTSEKQLQDYLIKKSRNLQMLSYKLVCVGRQGFPDVLIVTPAGVSHYIELKSPSGKGRLRPNQIRTINELRGYQANVHVFSSKAEVDAFLQTLETGAD